MIVATAALLSAPRIAALRLAKASCSRTTSTGASSGTVSMCAQSRIVRAPSGPGMRASRLPASEPVSAPLSSSSTSSPSARRSAVSASAIARSRRDGLSISQSRTKSPSRRVRSDCGGGGNDGRRTSDARRLPAASPRRRAGVLGGGLGVDLRLDLGRAAGRARASAAPTNSRKSGCVRSGRDLNSGWYCDATKNGWSGSSTTSTRRSSGEVPEKTMPACSSRLRRWLLTS